MRDRLKLEEEPAEGLRRGERYWKGRAESAERSLRDASAANRRNRKLYKLCAQALRSAGLPVPTLEDVMRMERDGGATEVTR